MEENKMQEAGTDLKEKRRPVSAKKLALMAVFVALSYGVSFLEIPIFPVAPFLKLDLGNVFILLIGFLLGPIEGIIVCALKESLRLIGSSSGGVGELANMLVTTSYIAVPTIVYRFRKGLKSVTLSLVAACFVGVGAALLANRFINFPLYMGKGAAASFKEFFGVIVAFNFIKTVSVGVICFALYKRLSNFLKKIKI